MCAIVRLYDYKNVRLRFDCVSDCKVDTFSDDCK